MIKDSRDLVFSAVNFHVKECGTPPAIRDDGASSRYCGYFVNHHGEQWVVVIDRDARAGVLRGGDIGWSEEVPIKDGHIAGDLMLGPDEALWLQCCWRAACGEPLTG